MRINKKQTLHIVTGKNLACPLLSFPSTLPHQSSLPLGPLLHFHPLLNLEIKRTALWGRGGVWGWGRRCFVINRQRISKHRGPWHSSKQKGYEIVENKPCLTSIEHLQACYRIEAWRQCHVDIRKQSVL